MTSSPAAAHLTPNLMRPPLLSTVQDDLGCFIGEPVTPDENRRNLEGCLTALLTRPLPDYAGLVNAGVIALDLPDDAALGGRALHGWLQALDEPGEVALHTGNHAPGTPGRLKDVRATVDPARPLGGQLALLVARMLTELNVPETPGLRA